MDFKNMFDKEMWQYVYDKFLGKDIQFIDLLNSLRI